MLHHQPWKNDSNDDYLDKNHEEIDNGIINFNINSNINSSIIKLSDTHVV